MEIQGTGPLQGPRRIDGRKTEPAASAPGPGPSLGADRVEFSAKAQFLSKLAQVPEVRMERIREIRALIERGQYETPEKFRVAVDRLMEDLR
ncbi:MAG: flagellar biosynthesis anti-sigma factor FlgM [Planctomycetes bacterium]|nr:flagellar biosynthesis anti-sigma factor FlgM [Planctomycetota bacterium]